MKTELIACLINCIIGVLLAIPSMMEDSSEQWGDPAGLSFLLYGAASLVVSLIIFIMRKHAIARGVLLSCVLLIVTGFAVCS